MNILNKSLYLLLPALMSGCATESFLQNKQKSSESAKSAQNEFQGTMDARTKDLARSAYRENDGIYVTKNALQLDKGSDLPEVFNSTISISANPRSSIKDFGSMIMGATGIPVVYSSEISADILQPVMAQGFSESITLKAMLDLLAARHNIYWKYNNREIVMFRQETRVFNVYAFTGNSEFNVNIANLTSSTAQGSQNRTGQSTIVQSKSKFWEDVKNDIKLFISPNGSYAVSENIGIISVTDTPKVLAEVANYVSSINEKKSRQIMISVKVYSVETREEDNYAVDWNAVYNAVSGKFGLSFVSPSATTGLGNFSAIISSGQFNGTESVIGALSKQGATALVTENTAVTVSGEAVPINSTKEITYLASVSSTSVANAGTSVSLTPGTVTSGFSMQTLPLVLDGKNLMIQTSIDFSSVDAINTVTSGSGTNQQQIQTPEKSTKSLIGKYVMKSGETLMLTGFQQTENGYESSGVGSATNIAGLLAGGKRKASGKKSALVIFITPAIIERK